MNKFYTLFLFIFITLFSGNVWSQINENIQSWTNQGSYGSYTQNIFAGTINMTDCIVANNASATGTCTKGRVQLKATTGILELPTLSSVGDVEVHLAAGSANRTLKLQYYNGSSWVDLTTFSGIGTTGATYTYTYNTISSTKLRFSSPSAALYIHDIIISLYTPSGKTVTFKVNGGVGSDYTQNSSTPANLTSFSTIGFTRSCYNFTGWNTSADGSGTTYADSYNYSFSSDMTLYAQWASTSHSVTFDANGGSGSMSNQTACSNTALTANVFTYSGYSFDGWATSPTGSVVYADGANYNFSSDVTLYAKWSVYVGPCFSEDFASITNGNNTSTSGSGTAWSGNTDFPTVSTAYQAGGAVKLGTGSNPGSITSRALTEVDGDVNVKFDVKGWTTVEGDIVVTLNGSSKTVTYTAKMADAFENKSINFTSVPAGSTLIIATTAKRAFIDNIQLYCTPLIPTPEINIKQNTSNIPHSIGSYDFGNQQVSSSSSPTEFTIENLGSATLNLTDSSPYISIGGTNATDFSITAIPSSSINASNSTFFKITFTPSAIGLRTATISIPNDDADENPYTFVVKGTGTNSNLSDIIRNTSYTENSNHDYTLYQANPIVSTSNSVGVFKFTIRDGGASTPDADALGTELNAITFQVTNIENIHSAALFGGASQTTLINNTPTINIGAGTITFTGLSGTNVTATDNSTQDITLRVSYLTTVIDKQQLQYTIASATANSTGSTFATTNASGASSSITGDRNRIKVTATKLMFVQQPTNTSINATMSPAPTVKAVDANNNLDLDYTSNISITSAGTMTGSSLSSTPSSGVATFSSVVHTVDGIGFTLTATSGTLTSATSNLFNITTFTYVSGDFRPLYSGTDLSYNGDWEYYNGSSWGAVPDGKAPQNTTTTIGRVLIDKYVNGGGSASKTYNCDFIIMNGGELYIVDDKASPSTMIASGKKLEVQNGGILTIEGDIGIVGNLIVREGGLMTINQAVTNDHAMWSGTENFENGSTVTIKNWNFSTSATKASLMNVSTAISDNEDGWKFGNLILDVNTSINNWALIGGGIGIINLVQNNLDVSNSATTAYYITGATNKTGTNGFIVNGDMTIHDGSFAFGSSYSSDAFNHTFTVNGNFKYAGNDNLQMHYIGNGTPSGLNGSVTVKRNFTVENTALSFSTDKASNNSVIGLNLNGDTIQKLKIYPTVVAIPITIKTGASVVQKSTDITLNSLTSVTSTFTVESGATYNWSWADDGITPLVIKTVNNPSGTIKFTSNQGATLKITDSHGLMADPAIDALGNVQGITKTNRTINNLATFWYIGKTDQNTGDCFGTTSNGKQIICDLADNSKQLTLTTQTGLTENIAISLTGGKLDIRKGKFIETEDKYITGSTGTLYMAPGTLYKIAKGYNALTTEMGSSGGTYIPRMLGSTYAYSLTGGTIELGGNSATGNGFQTLRGKTNTYHNITFSGTNQYDNTNKIAIDYKNLSDQTTIPDSLYITGNAIVDCKTTGAGTAASFIGDGGLVMDGGRIRMKKLNTQLPELTGINQDYILSGGIVEFYGSGSTQQQKIRGTYGTADKTIEYYDMEINADAGNYESGNGGNVDVTNSFTLQGTMNVNAPAVLRMDKTDFIYKYIGNTTNTVNINDGAGLLYGSPFGITTVTTVGTGLEPTKGGANPPAGNIRTNNRNFSEQASYGFIGNGDMFTGDGIPNQVAGLYVYKTFATDVVTLSKSILNNGKLVLDNGKLKSTATNKLTLETTATIENTPINAGGIANMGHENSYVIGLMGRNSNSTTELVFPIGSDTIYGPLAVTPQNSNNQTYNAEYISQGFGNYKLDPANLPQLDHVSYVEYWNLKSSLSPSANDDAKVKLYWRTHSQVSASSGDWASLRVAHFDGTDWNMEGTSPTINYNSDAWGFVQSNNYCADFSPFTLGTLIPSNPLPVELISFTGQCNDDDVQLNWITASETNSHSFVIEKSFNAVDFYPIGIVQAAGHSTVELHYQFIDELPNSKTYYRLLQIDLDGKEHIQPIVYIKCGIAINGVNTYYSGNNQINVEIQTDKPEDYIFNIFQADGKLIYSENKSVQAGKHLIPLVPKQQLSKGIYLLQSVNGGNIQTKKLFVD